MTERELKAKIKSFEVEDWVREELYGEGFPYYMTLAFLQAAKEKNTVISSRLPGGVGVDLIENGCDLKGFHIKAKSCDWGPMAGFICQLPFLNKKGYSKIGYNTHNIADYLIGLERFREPSSKIRILQRALQQVMSVLEKFETEIDLAMGLDEILKELEPIFSKHQSVFELTTDEVSHIKEILTNTTEPRSIRKIREDIAKVYYAKINIVTKHYQELEQTRARWSGENSLPSTPGSPFIPIKRCFTKDDILNRILTLTDTKLGIVESRRLNDRQIIGTACNNDNKLQSTIIIDFLLLRDEDDPNLWGVYYHKVGFRKTTGDTFEEYVFGSKTFNDTIWEKLGVKDDKNPVTPQNVTTFNRIFSQLGTPIVLQNIEGESIEYYPVCGFMNAHPPYPEKIPKGDNPDFYKNAVSGDYDLFAFWPSVREPLCELIRQSEYYLNQILKLYFGSDLQFCIEFIPGFSELVQYDDAIKLKESAELGNISDLGSTISASLNSFAATIFKARGGTNVALNKAFHSDEGGRPGIMEIEFPIAFFFPGPISSATLNNQYRNGKRVPPLVGREKITTSAGLIKSPGEFLRLLAEINSKDSKQRFQILMHSEWMIHLFYISMNKTARDNFRNKTGDFRTFIDEFKDRDGNGNLITDREKLDKREEMIADKITEFNTIEKNHKGIYINEYDFDQAGFERELKNLLFPPNKSGKDETIKINAVFDAMRLQFLKMAFLGDRSAFLRKHDFEILFKSRYVTN